MATVKVKPSSIDNIEGCIKRMCSESESAKTLLSHAINGLEHNMEIMSKRGIQSKLNSISNSLTQQVSVAQTLQIGFVNAAGGIVDVDNKYGSESKSIFDKISTFVGTKVGRIKSFFLNNKITKYATASNLFLVGASTLSGTILSRVKDSFNGLSWLSNKTTSNKADIKSTSTAKTYNSSPKDYIKDKWDKAVDSTRNTVKTGENVTTYGSSEKGTFWGEQYTHNTDVRQVKYSTEYYDDSGIINDVRNIDGNISIITDQYILGDDDGNLAFNLNEMNAGAAGKFDILKGDAYVSADYQYNVASLEGTLKNDWLSVNVGGDVGAGGGVDVGVHDGKLNIGVSAALGLGGHANVTINYGKMIEEGKDFLDYSWNTIKGWFGAGNSSSAYGGNGSFGSGGFGGGNGGSRF